MKVRPHPCRFTWLPLALVLALPAAAKPVPTEVFSAPPDFSGLSLSPDGTRLAMLTPVAGGLQSLVLMDLATNELKGIRSAPGHDIAAYRWVNDDQLLFTVTIRRLYAGGLYVADARSLRVGTLNEFDATHVVDPLPAEPHHAWLWISQTHDGSASRLIKIDTRRTFSSRMRREFDQSRQEIERVAPPPGRVHGWTTDRQGRVRLAQVERNDQLEWHHRRDDSAEWEPLQGHRGEFSPWVFEADGSLLVFAHQGHDTAGIVRYDPVRRAWGGSFGGYLALCGAAFEPDRYRCAVSIVGVFDWEQLIRDKRRADADFVAAQLDRGLGTGRGGEEDEEAFARVSPLLHSDAIRIPVFIAHGTDDTNVSVAQSRRLVRELRTRGVPHETMFKTNEGHGFAQPENRRELLERVERFLAQHLR